MQETSEEKKKKSHYIGRECNAKKTTWEWRGGVCMCVENYMLARKKIQHYVILCFPYSLAIKRIRITIHLIVVPEV